MSEQSRADLLLLLASTTKRVRVILTSRGRDVRIPAAQAAVLAQAGRWLWLSSRGQVTKMREIYEAPAELPMPEALHQSSAFGPWPGWWERQHSARAA